MTKQEFVDTLTELYIQGNYAAMYELFSGLKGPWFAACSASNMRNIKSQYAHIASEAKHGIQLTTAKNNLDLHAEKELLELLALVKSDWFHAPLSEADEKNPLKVEVGDLLARASAQLSIGEYANAERIANHALTSGGHITQSASAMNIVGQALWLQNDLLGAIEAYQWAIDRVPDNPAFWSNLGSVTLEKGDIERASMNFQKSIELDDQHSIGYLGVGLCHQQKGQYAAAIEWMVRAITLEPNRPESHAHLAKAYYQNGQGDKAREFFDLAARKEYPSLDNLRQELNM